MEETGIAALVDEVKAWTKKLSASSTEVVDSLEKMGGATEGVAESLRKGCGAVATSMTQLVACCHKAQKAVGTTAKDASSFVSTMNGFVVACIALTKGLIKLAKTAMVKKNTALSEASLEEARSLLADLRENCGKIARCASEVISRSPKPERRRPTMECVPASKSPTAVSPRGTSDVDRQLLAAIKDVMAKKEGFTRAIDNRDAVDFVSKAKEFVASFSGLKKATFRHLAGSTPLPLWPYPFCPIFLSLSRFSLFTITLHPFTVSIGDAWVPSTGVGRPS